VIGRVVTWRRDSSLANARSRRIRKAAARQAE
jgi:hypothetical protein